jgi:hypothetical protein
LSAVLAALAVAVPAIAITNGQRDNGEHPFVGTLLVRQSGELFSCSGTLLSSTVMLTAGHCTEFGGIVNSDTWVTFVEEVDVDAIANRDRTLYPTVDDFLDDPVNGWTHGTAIPHPQFDDGALFPLTYDVGVVVLDSPVVMPAYGQLPTLNQFESLRTKKGAARDRRFTVVGYGIQRVVPKPFAQSDWARYKGETTLIGSESSISDGVNFKFTNSPGKGNGSGGTCLGDSGGPALWGDTRIVAAINSFGITPNCTGNDYMWRADIGLTLDFVKQYLPH